MSDIGANTRKAYEASVAAQREWEVRRGLPQPYFTEEITESNVDRPLQYLAERRVAGFASLFMASAHLRALLWDKQRFVSGSRRNTFF